MGIVFRGLILAAVLAATMSNLSASFNSSASSLMSDWLGKWLPKTDDRKGLRMARLLTVASAIVHAGVAIAVSEIGLQKSVVDAVLSLARFAIGLLRGPYALGLISRRRDRATPPRAVHPLARHRRQAGGVLYVRVGRLCRRNNRGSQRMLT